MPSSAAGAPPFDIREGPRMLPSFPFGSLPSVRGNGGVVRCPDARKNDPGEEWDQPSPSKK